ncbi:MAG: hypothetical protein HUJ42_00040 [Malacoplasma sp.]|nr:hypothetical protein [Malacoplasma sp.]
MNKIFNINSALNVFELWKKVQTKVNLIQSKIIQEKQEESRLLLDKYNLIFSKVSYINNSTINFDSNIFIALIKYLMDSNNFFDKRLTDNQIDELLILAYIYEWLVLNKSKDVTLLGDQYQTLEKFKNITIQSNSYFKFIFDNVNIRDSQDLITITQNIQTAAEFSFNQIFSYIQNDNQVYQKIINQSNRLRDFDNKKECLDYWNHLFLIKTNGLNFVYSIHDSDFNIIYVSAETDNEKIAAVRFKIFHTYTNDDNKLIATGIGKELLRIDFFKKSYSSQVGEILSNSLKIANRAIKSIFLLELQLKNDEENQIPIKKNKKIVNIIRK